MLTTKRKPATVGEILVEDFMQPMRLTQGALAAAMGVQRKHVNELCNDRRGVTAATALILARIRQRSRFLAQCAAAQRFVGSIERSP
jgi:addiction module HigA family antidote